MSEGAKPRSVWFWLCIAYLIVTISFNVWKDWGHFSSFSWLDRLSVTINLVCKAVAIPLLVCRRGEGIYLLLAAFVVGVAGTIWDFYPWAAWPTVPQLARAALPQGIGIAISLAIVLFMIDLKRRGILRTKSSG